MINLLMSMQIKQWRCLVKLSHSTTIHNNFVHNNSASNVQSSKPTDQNVKTDNSTENRVAPPVENAHEAINEVNEQDLQEIQKRAIEQANKSLKQYDRVIERAVHPVTHTLMYTVKDEKTNEVIAEFPPRKIQDMVAKMWEMAGLVVDAKV